MGFQRDGGCHSCSGEARVPQIPGPLDRATVFSLFFCFQRADFVGFAPRRTANFLSSAPGEKGTSDWFSCFRSSGLTFTAGEPWSPRRSGASVCWRAPVSRHHLKGTRRCRVRIQSAELVSQASAFGPFPPAAATSAWSTSSAEAGIFPLRVWGYLCF